MILDFTMPKVTGPEAFRKIRQIAPKAKILMMSGFDAQEMIDGFLSTRGTQFMQKPFTADALLETVGLLLSQR